MSQILTRNAKCLAFHGPLLYEAKILKIHEKNKNYIEDKDGQEVSISESNLPEEFHDQIAYFIHYKGWKSSWDEWVDEKRVLAWTYENLRTQKELKAAALASSSTSIHKKRTSSETDENGSSQHSNGGAATTNGGSAGHKKRRGVDSTLEKEDEFLKRPEISLTIPNRLKSLLVDDWEFVTKDHQLIKLPVRNSVKDIIARYKKHVTPTKRPGSSEAGILDEVLSGLELYFNRSLGVILLYRFERNQYLETKKKLHKDAELSSIYGAEHLLRLFVSLPGLIAQTSMDQQSIGILKDYLEDFLKFLESHYSEFFNGNYENVSPSYDSLSKAS